VSAYKNILVAVDLNEEAISLVEKAKQFLGEDGSIKIFHVGSVLATLMPVSSMGSSIPDDVEVFQKEYTEQSINYLHQMAQKTKIEPENIHLVFGSEVHEIKQFAQEDESDLLIIGLHKSKGLSRILGSVAQGTLKQAPCDVLSVLV
jgi:universal stress protein A